jgi:hypothetical protein
MFGPEDSSPDDFPKVVKTLCVNAVSLPNVSADYFRYFSGGAMKHSSSELKV